MRILCLRGTWAAFMQIRCGTCCMRIRGARSEEAEWGAPQTALWHPNLYRSSDCFYRHGFEEDGGQIRFIYAGIPFSLDMT